MQSTQMKKNPTEINLIELKNPILNHETEEIKNKNIENIKQNKKKHNKSI